MDHGYGFQPLPVPGAALRNYQGEQDLPAMLDVFRSACPGGHDLDHDDVLLESLEDITHKYRHLTNCDPYQDVLIAEVNARMVAFGRVTWWQVEVSGGGAANSGGGAASSGGGGSGAVNSGGAERIYFMGWYIRPEWRGQGLDKVFLDLSKERLRQIIRQQERKAAFRGARLFEANATSLQPDRARLLEEDGFQAVQWASMMTCRDLQNIPEGALPAGLEIRPVRPEHYRPVWDALQDAFRADAGFVEPSEAEYAGWQQSAQFQPDLWQVAWAGDQVIGMALNVITQDALTEYICVRPDWRRRGLARALLARSMTMFRAMGFTQASLGVDINNPHGARRLYESMGYQVVRLITIYRKPADE